MRFWRRRSDDDFREEVEAHVDLETHRLVAGGMSRDEARSAARRAFGNVTGYRELFRERQRGVVIEQFQQDLVYAARTMRRSPGFAAIAIICLAVGIAVNTATFSVLNAFLLRDFPGVRRQHELVTIQMGYEASWGRTSPFYGAVADYEALQTGIPAFSAVSADGRTPMAARIGGDPRVVMGDVVSGNFFSVLGATPAQGRFFDDRDVASDASVAVASFSYAEQNFGSVDRAVNRSVTIGMRSFTIVGVTQRGFFGVRPAEVIDAEKASPALFVPLSAAPSVRAESRTPSSEALEDKWLQVVARLAPGATLAEARAQAQGAAARLVARYPAARKAAFAEVRNGWNVGEDLADMVIVMCVPLLILLVACANLANQLLARAVHRSREIAVRLSLGATRARVVRQLLAESALLGGAATVLGLVIARVLLDLIRAYFVSIPFRVPIDARVLGFTLAVAAVTVVAFGLVPALRATRRDLVAALKQGAPGSGFYGARLRNALVVFQVATSFALITLTGLFVRAAQTSRVDVSDQPAGNLLAVELDLDLVGYGAPAGRAFQAGAIERLRALPGVEAVGLAPFGPSERIPERQVSIPGSDRVIYADVGDVSGDWFAANDIAAIHGRLFTVSEAAGAPTVAVVDEALARRLWPDHDAVGRTLRVGADSGVSLATVIGVIRTRPDQYGMPTSGVALVPAATRYSPHTVLYVKTRADAATLRAPIRGVVQSIDPALPIVSVRTAREARALDFTPVRLLASGVGALGSLALALSALGLFGVLSFIVAQRTREIGVRLALGAQRGAVTRMVLAQTLSLAGIGIAIGGVIAGVVATLMRAFLYGLAPLDAIAFGTAVVVMVGVAIVASLEPARRAASVDPIVALRAD